MRPWKDSSNHTFYGSGLPVGAGVFSGPKAGVARFVPAGPSAEQQGGYGGEAHHANSRQQAHSSASLACGIPGHRTITIGIRGTGPALP